MCIDTSRDTPSLREDSGLHWSTKCITSDEIHAYSELVLKQELQINEASKGRRVDEIDQDVQVTIRPGVTPRDRTEDV
jgi:hypothetical protein